jgi:hypothetical protein
VRQRGASDHIGDGFGSAETKSQHGNRQQRRRSVAAEYTLLGIASTFGRVVVHDIPLLEMDWALWGNMNMKLILAMIPDLCPSLFLSINFFYADNDEYSG